VLFFFAFEILQHFHRLWLGIILICQRTIKSLYFTIV